MSPPTINETGGGQPSAAHEPDTMLWPPTSVTSEAPAPLFEGSPAEVGALATPSVRKAHDESERINWFIPLVFIPLVLYAVLATAAAGFLYLRIQTRPPSLFEQFPDVDGDNPGVNRKPKGGVHLRFNREDATKPLPEKLHVKLGDTIRLGDLEVTPLRVRRQRVKIVTEGAQDDPQPLPYDSLVLTLKFNNWARDYAFAPLDNYFDRHWDGSQSSVPLTILLAGKTKFFGGPVKWYPLNQSERKRERREWVALPGRKKEDRQELLPGESMEACICTDGADAAVAARLFGIKEAGKPVQNAFAGDLLWRVQVRRGLIDYNGKNRPAVAVIGVEFTPKDYTN
jgi:hypothetical protein